MNRTPQAKAQASILVREMQEAGIILKHQQALEMVAKMSGHRDWNAMSSSPATDEPQKSNTSTKELATLSAKLEQLRSLATDVLDNCDNAGCDGLTVTSQDSVDALSDFVGRLQDGTTGFDRFRDFDPDSQIALIWGVEDVLEIRKDLTEEQAFEVLKTAERRHDASVGINWDVLEAHADWITPAPSDDNSDEDGGDNDD